MVSVPRRGKWLVALFLGGVLNVICCTEQVTPAGPGQICADRPCVKGWACHESICRELCNTNAECASGEYACADGVCLRVPNADCARGPDCVTPGPCETADDAQCRAGSCSYIRIPGCSASGCQDADGDGLGNGASNNDDCANRAVDWNDSSRIACADTDGDTCDDCTSATFAPHNDGPDADHDQICDAGDPDDDDDGVLDDGDLSDEAGDAPCTDGASANCDDNCISIANPDQEDSDGDGIGDACQDTSCSSATRWDEFGSGTIIEPHLICTPAQLSSLGDLANTSGLSRYFRLNNDIDMTGWDESNFNTIGYHFMGDAFHFTGTFDGDHKTISNLNLNLPDWPWTGLFSYVEGDGVIDGSGDGQIKNLNLVNFDIVASNTSGVLVGRIDNGSITNCSASGVFEGNWRSGGLIGWLNNSVLSDSHSTVTVSSSTGGTLGGLIGSVDGGSKVERCFATGAVTGGWEAGGLVAACGNTGGSIIDSYARGAVLSSDSNVGGLIGTNKGCDVLKSYSSGAIEGIGDVGGISGVHGAGSYAGVIWHITANPSLTATGIGDGANLSGIYGRTTSQMRSRSTYTDQGWDFSTVWTIDEAADSPTLLSPP